MTRRTIALTASFSLAVLLAAAEAQTKTGTGTLKLLGAQKPDKKQMEIDRHEWTAQYYAVRVHDLVRAAKEYQAILAMAPDNEHAALALASLYFSDKKDKEAVGVLTKLTRKTPRARTPGWRSPNRPRARRTKRG